MGTAAIKPGSTVSEVLWASNKSRGYRWQTSAAIATEEFPGETVLLSREASMEPQNLGLNFGSDICMTLVELLNLCKHLFSCQMRIIIAPTLKGC